MHEDLARRSIHSVKWNGIGNFFQIIVGFIQLVVLARLLPIESFGVYSGAVAVTTLLGGISVFGLAEAFKFRCKETIDIEQTAAVHFTLQLVITLIWTVLMVAGGFLFIKSNADGYLLVFIVLTLSKAAANFANTPKVILSQIGPVQTTCDCRYYNSINYLVDLSGACFNKPTSLGIDDHPYCWILD